MATRHAQMDPILSRLKSPALREALLVTIEYIHRADTATLELLANLAGNLRNTRALVIARYRRDNLDTAHLTAAAVAELEKRCSARIYLPDETRSCSQNRENSSRGYVDR